MRSGPDHGVWATATLFVLLAAGCGTADRSFIPDDQFYGHDAGADSSAGTGGNSGSAGAAGTSGTAGSAGGAGGAGTGGTAGGAGSDGGAGVSGSAGSTAGASGASGAAGSDGGANACDNVACDAPPANTCANSTALTVYDAPGTCDAGACSYASHEQACPFGCANDACTNDPCAGVTCSAPPSPTCNGSDRRVYTTPGACNAGTCSYGYSDSPCTFGCTNGTCNSDPCQGVTCNTPPGAACVNSSTLRTYALPGTCGGGSCSYAYTDQSCPGGCAGTTCNPCTTSGQCASNEWCSAGTCTTCSGAACGDGECDCGETSGSCAADCGPPCPTALSIGAWDSGNDGWALDGLWQRQSGGYMKAGSSTSYSSSYTQNLTSGSAVDLSTCTAATLGFSVKLIDDATYTPDSDKSERLYVQCSGDGGSNWTNLTPNPWPANQSACSTSYCDGDDTIDRSFGWTSQTITLPVACRTATARFRFQAKGSSAWRIWEWDVDSVVVN